MTTATRHAITPAAPVDDWARYGSCRQTDPEIFFPVGTSGPALKQTEQAKEICTRCPVRQECLSWALESGQETGVWGGLSEWERGELSGRERQYRTSSDDRPAWQVIVDTRLDEYRELEAAGLSAWEIGQRMRTNAHTINRVRAELAVEQVVAA